MVKLNNYDINIFITLGNGLLKPLKYDDLVSFEIHHNSKDAQLSLMPGLIEQSYTLNFYDRNDVFKKSFEEPNARKQLFKKYFEINVKANSQMGMMVPSNTLTPDDDLYPNDVANLSTNIFYRGYYVDIDYSIKNKLVTIKATDISSNLNKMNINKAAIKTRTIDELFQYALSNKYVYADEALAITCKNTILPNTFVSNQTYRELIDKICKAAMVNIYIENYVENNGTNVDKYVIRRCY